MKIIKGLAFIARYLIGSGFAAVLIGLTIVLLIVAALAMVAMEE